MRGIEKIAAVVTAAGLSSRMGEFKPLLPFAGDTIAGHLVNLLRALKVEPVIVVTGYQADYIESCLARPGVRFVRNQDFRETDMFHSVVLGLQTVLKETNCHRVLILPVDLPGIQPGTVERVLASDAPVVRAMYRGRGGHPVALSREAAAAICDAPGDGGLRGALTWLGMEMTEVEVDDPGIHWDVDTPEEYRALTAWMTERRENLGPEKGV